MPDIDRWIEKKIEAAGVAIERRFGKVAAILFGLLLLSPLIFVVSYALWPMTPEQQYQRGLNYYKSYKGAYPREDSYELAFDYFQRAAKRGNANAQFALGTMHSRWDGSPPDDPLASSLRSFDYIQAYKWFELAVSQLSGKQREAALEGRDMAASKLTPKQLALAQKWVREWKPQ